MKKTESNLPKHVSLKSGTFYFVAPTLDEHGKRKWHNLGKDYGAMLTQWAELMKWKHLPAVKENIGSLLDRWMAEHVPSLSEATQTDYKLCTKFLKEWCGEIDIDGLKNTDVRLYLDKRSSKVRGNREIQTLSSCFGWAVERGYATFNPCDGVRRNTEKPRKEMWKQIQIDAAKAAAKEIGYDIVSIYIDLALQTGLRKHDLLTITWGQISDGFLHTRSRKTDEPVSYELSPEFLSTLHRVEEVRFGTRRRIKMMEDRGIEKNDVPILCNDMFKAYTMDGFQTLLARVKRKAKENGHNIDHLHFHDMRANVGSAVAESGDIRQAQAVLGHKNAQTTERYLRQHGAKIVSTVSRYVEASVEASEEKKKALTQGGVSA